MYYSGSVLELQRVNCRTGRRSREAGKPVNKLWAEWVETHTKYSEFWFSKETHYESFCIGWCMGKGLTAEQAYEFYQYAVDHGVF